MKKQAIKWSLITAIPSGLVILYFLLPRLNDAQHQPQCFTQCKTGTVCMNTPFLWTSVLNVTCVPIPKKSPVVDIKLPFDANAKVYCTHSSGVGTHSWPNAYWALDLATPYNEANATIYTSSNGVAYISPVHCAEPKGSAAKSEGSFCGQGFGNWVKIYHGNGYYTLYAHLDRILVKNGTVVHQGQAIGIEGWTGNAGHRHVHWSVQKLPGTTEIEWNQRIMTYIGESVPFDFLAVQNNKLKTFDMTKLHCEYNNIDSTIDPKPTFSGLF